MAKLVVLLVLVCFQFSRPEEVPKIEQIQLDLDDGIPFNNQSAPDTEMLDGADKDQWYKGPDYDWTIEQEELPDTEPAIPDVSDDEVPFNIQTAPEAEKSDAAMPKVPKYGWANQKWPDYSDMLNDPDYMKMADDYEKMLLENYPDYFNEDAWKQPGGVNGQDYSQWNTVAYKYPNYMTEDTNIIINKKGQKYAIDSMTTITKINDFNAGKWGESWKYGKMSPNLAVGKTQPAKRFTSV